jgi:hypothetical protein
MRVSIVAFALVLFACGNAPAPAAPAPAASSTPPIESATPPPAPEAEPAPSKKQRPLEIHSSCAEVVTVVFGDDPKTGGRRTINEGGTLDGPRDDAGNMTMWLLNARGEPTTHVKITRGMKKVEIGRSCSTLDAR